MQKYHTPIGTSTNLAVLIWGALADAVGVLAYLAEAGGLHWVFACR
jgi:hypothetical protein